MTLCDAVTGSIQGYEVDSYPFNLAQSRMGFMVGLFLRFEIGEIRMLAVTEF